MDQLVITTDHRALKPVSNPSGSPASPTSPTTPCSPCSPTSPTSAQPIANQPTLLHLETVAQNYAWGKPASCSKVAQLLNKSNINNNNDDNTPYAELWMGTHKNGPSRVIPNNNNNNNNNIGEVDNESILLSEYLNGDLPYLFKILSIARALSIQVHPDKTVAKQLHLTRPNVYKDSNHKPEMAVALTPFEAMCGFRPYNEISHFLQNVEEFAIVVGEDVTREFIDTFVNNNKNGEDNYDGQMEVLLKKVFERVMKADKEIVEEMIEKLVNKMNDKENPWKIPNVVQNTVEEEKDDDSSTGSNDDEEFIRSIEINELILRLNSQFPKDVGIFAAFMLNCFKLRENEAVFLSANLPHAYLSGDCIECMACSDNVVRAGLTPKLRDTDVLCNIVEYIAQEPQIMFGEAISNNTIKYAPNVKEFRLTVTSLNPGDKEMVDFKENGCESDNASVLLVYEGNGKIDGMNVNEGDCLLVPNDVKCVKIVGGKNGNGIKVARCYAPKV